MLDFNSSDCRINNITINLLLLLPPNNFFFLFSLFLSLLFFFFLLLFLNFLRNSKKITVMDQESFIPIFPELPLGVKVKFDPSDEELMVYLACKCNGQVLPSEEFIKEVDLYSIIDPNTLFEDEEKSIYVFTKLKKISKNGKRIDRRVDGGRMTWKGVDGAKMIYNHRGILAGEKKNFVLINNKTKVGFNMLEFSLTQESLRNSKFNDYVICKVKKKKKGRVNDGGGVLVPVVHDPVPVAVNQEEYNNNNNNNNNYYNYLGINGDMVVIGDPNADGGGIDIFETVDNYFNSMKEVPFLFDSMHANGDGHGVRGGEDVFNIKLV